MSTPIAENDVCVVDLRANEVCNRTKDNFPDPAKYRGGAGPNSPIKIIYSGESKRADGQWEEIGLLKFAQDERHRGDPFNFTGEIELFCRHHVPGTGDDQQFKRVARFRHDGIEFFVPVAFAARVTRFYSDDGRYCFNVQGDNGGFIVQYETHGSADETTWTAVATLRGQPL